MGKGRNSDLIEKRNMALLKRYHYWTEIQRLRFDDTLKVLSKEEFFISEERIMSIIRESSKKDSDILPVPKVRKPKITAAQLALFID